MRHAIAALLVSASLTASPVADAANTWGTDMSDLWITSGEDGWGANIAHQGDMLFITFFIYGQDSRPKWYVASGMQSRGGSSSYVFDGALYEGSGPWFGAFFNRNLVSLRQVGSATFNATSISQGTLTYSIDGVQVSKTISRYLFRYNNLAGSYVGAAIGTTSGCASGNGSFENAAVFSVSHSASSNSVTIVATIDNGGSCTYSGTYSQQGRMGRIQGTMTCNNGAQATFDAFEIEAGYNGFFTRYNSSYGGTCQETGRIVAMSRQ